MPDTSDSPDERERAAAGVTAVQAALAAENAALRARVIELEARVRALSPPPIAPPTAVSTTAATTAATTASTTAATTAVSAAAPPQTPPRAPAAATLVRGDVPPIVVAPPPRQKLRIEHFVGRRIVPLVGAIAVLGAVGFLVSHALDIGFFGRLSAEARFTAGIAIGAALLAAGEVVRRRASAAAAVGLDAAGVGAFMVTIALGVFVLDLFGPEMGASLTLAAGVFGAAWSVRTRSVTVGIAAVLGSFILPVAFGEQAHSGLLGGLLLTAALATGLAMHALGDGRFAAVRWLTIVLLLLSGGVWTARSADASLTSPMYLLWFALIVGEATLAAIRGQSARANSAVVVIASLGACCVQVSVWGERGTLFSFADLRAWLPIAAGGVLLGQALLLRGFVSTETDDEQSPDDHGARTITAACAMLGQMAFALAVALGIGGFVQFLPSAVQALAWATMAVGCVVLARHEKSLAFGVVSCVFALLTAPFAIAAVVIVPFPRPTGSLISLPFGALITLNLTAECLGGFAAALLLFASLGLTLTRVCDILRALCVALVWIVVSVSLTDGDLFCATMALPACIIACMPRARRLLAVTALVLLLPTVLVWNVMLFDWRFGGPALAKWNMIELATINLFVMATGAILVSNHPSLGAARRVLCTIAIIAMSGAFGVYGLMLGGDRGFASGDMLLSLTVALATFAAIVISIGDLRRRTDLVEGGSAAVVLSLVAGSVAGLFIVFERAHQFDTTVTFALATLLSTALATTVAARALSRATNALPFARHIVLAAGCSAFVPIGAILVAAACGRPLAAFAASAWIILAALAEITIGFRYRIPALRWAGLASFVLVVARLYIIDLASTPILVRVGLLFATGMVLVGVGIVYSKRESREIAGGTES